MAAAAYTRAVIASMPAVGAPVRRSSPPGAAGKKAVARRGRKKLDLVPASQPGSHPPDPIEVSPGRSPLRVLVLHGPDNASKHEMLAWLRSSDVGADARTVGEMLPSTEDVVDDRVDIGIEWAAKFIALVTPDKRSPSGAPNVIDEIGRIRGKGRSSDLAIVRQRTCDELWSNLAGVVRIEFDQRVKEAMLCLAKFLGVLGPGPSWGPAQPSSTAPLPKVQAAATQEPTSPDPEPQRPPARDEPSQKLWTWLEQQLRGAPEATRLLATGKALADHLKATRRRGASDAVMRPAVADVIGIDLPAAVADALLAVDACTVASALNAAHGVAEGPARAVLGEVLFHVLPFATDLGEVRRRASEAIKRNERSVELPFRTETLAEIVSAGVDGRPIDVLSTGPFPAGVASVALPATGYAPLFTGQNEVFVQDVAIQLCREDGPANEKFVELKRRFVKDSNKRERDTASPEELRRTVQVLLRRLHDRARPRYLLFIDQDLKAEGEKSVDHLWGLVRGAVEHKERGLDGLRLIRLSGGVDDVASEFDIALHISEMKNRR